MCIVYFSTHTAEAIYGNTVGPGEFHYVSYIYLCSPIQTVIINPIGFFCLEYNFQKTRTNPHKSVSWRALLGKIVWNLTINPFINMTLLGLLINVIMSKGIHGGESDYNPDGNLKKWMKQFLTLLGNAYNASALLYLGICMVGKLNNLNGILVLKSLLMFAVKM